MIRVLTVASVALVFGIGGAAAAGRVTTTCQKNLDDGRILVEDYRTLPDPDATFKVVRFKAAKSDGTWAHGPCVLQLTGHAR